MNAKPNNQIRKFLQGIVLAGMMLFLCLGVSGSPAVHAQEVATPGPNDYYTVNTVTLSDGTVIEEDIINGPPVPPPGFEIERQAVSLPEPDSFAGINTLTVPAFDWVFGCSAVSGAMIAGYYDRNGYPNIYTGPRNDGVMPLDNSSWDTWSDGTTTYPNLPLAASRNGVDGRTTNGSIDDYWVKYWVAPDPQVPDPYITGGWTQHTWGDAIGDYMKTSQSAFGNNDGSTHFYTWTGLATRLTCDDMVSGEVNERDGTYGRKLFYEARGYTVTDCYNQKTDNNGGGFTFALFKAEIDAGRPVMLNLAGHTVVGVGYDDTTNTVHIHDTWDYNDHTMTWGGSYTGYALQSVSIVNIQSSGDFNKSAPANGATGQPANPTLSWGSSSSATSYEYCIDSISNNTCDTSWISTGTSTSVPLSGLALGNHSWQVRANNASGTKNADVGTWWSFNTAASPPGDFNKSAPANGATGQQANSTLSWGASSNATSYEYCIDTISNNACDTSWISTGTSTSVPLSGLAIGNHSWQVRANNALGTTNANGGTWWSFTSAVSPPGDFNKSVPANDATGQQANPTLSWGSSSNTTSYEYCIDTISDNTCDTSWISTGTSTSVGLSGLTPATSYYWQVRANNALGTTNADGGTWWSFTTVASPPIVSRIYLPLVLRNFASTPPGDFNKSAPANGATSQQANPTLSWGSSSNATSYEYCIDTSNNNACDTTWASTAASTSVGLSGLTPTTPYYWQVRANNASGTTNADGGTWWSFTTAASPPPGGGIVNGDFESGSTDWTLYTKQGAEWMIVSKPPLPVAPHRGSYAAWLGGLNSEINYVQQQVTIPASAPYLVYWQWISSADICDYDFGGVLINGSVEDEYDLCDTNNTYGWVTHSVNLSAYAGQSVTLQIRVETDSSGNSNLYVDDVSLQASASALGPIQGVAPNLDASPTQGKIGIVAQGEKPQGIGEKRLLNPR